MDNELQVVGEGPPGELIKVYYQHEETGNTFNRYYFKEEDIETFPRYYEYKREVIKT